MVEWTLMVLKEGALGSLNVIKSLVMIIIPLMILLQIMIDYKWLERLSQRTKFLTDFIGVSKETLVPLLIGIFAGVSYGASAIIFAKDQYALPRNDVFLAMCFIVPFHAIAETALIYWMLGVNPVLLLTTRLVVAVAETLFFKRLVLKRLKKAEEPPSL